MDVYSYGLGPIPWSIAHGTIYKTDKAALLNELEKDVQTLQHIPPDASWIIDFFGHVQVLKEPLGHGSVLNKNGNPRPLEMLLILYFMIYVTLHQMHQELTL